MSTIISLFIFSLIYGQDYYWHKGDKVPLSEIESKKYVVLDQAYLFTKEDKSTLEVLNEVLEIERFDFNQIIHSNSGSNLESFSWTMIENAESSKAIQSDDSRFEYVSNFYRTENGSEVGISQFFYVKLRSSSDVSQLEAMARKHQLKIAGQNPFNEEWFVLSCTKESSNGALAMANLFYESGFFDVAQPDFLVTVNSQCVNDTYFDDQWGLKNTGQNGGTTGIDINLCDAHLITSGSSDIIIAVLDGGVELDHPDLPNMAISYNSQTGTSPSAIIGNNPHGTACAGIIGADSDNNLGVAGIAPDCPIMSISNKFTYSSSTLPLVLQRLANGINFAWQNNASVISNSWGIGDGIQSSVVEMAIDDAILFGRNGLGTVVVFGGGNISSSIISYPGNSNPDVLNVGAASPCGKRKTPSSCDGVNGWGSNYGNDLDIMAPGVLIPTTDRQGSNGYNTNSGSSGDYTLDFGGTSAACPHIAAVAGLVLSANPFLSQKEVANIIESTAQKTGGYSYQTTSGRPNGTWHTEMGYGFVDAHAAVQEAECSTTIFENITISSINYGVQDCNVIIRDVSIENNKFLNVDYQFVTIIEKNFEMELGTELTIETY